MLTVSTFVTGNIILHLFASNECRQTYDLESLWAAGPEFDEQAQGVATTHTSGKEESSSAFFPMQLTEADWERIVAEVAAERAAPEGEKK